MKLFDRRVAPLAILAIVLGVALVTIRLGFYIDDYAIQAGLSGRWPNGPAAWDLYRFTYLDEAHNRAAIAASDLPWWSVPTLKLHLVRPLTSLGFFLDTKVFGNAAPLGWHLHSIAWYLLLVHLVGVVLRRLLPRGTANPAMLIFGLSTAHFFAYAWIACRHMPIAAAIGLLRIHALVREHRYASVIFAACLGVSLLAGETAIGIAVFGLVFLVATTRPTGVMDSRKNLVLLICRQCFGASSRRRDRSKSSIRRLACFRRRSARSSSSLWRRAIGRLWTCDPAPSSGHRRPPRSGAAAGARPAR